MRCPYCGAEMNYCRIAGVYKCYSCETLLNEDPEKEQCPTCSAYLYVVVKDDVKKMCIKCKYIFLP